MITPQKKLIYAAALVVSTGLFANEVVNATGREEPPEPIERPAEDLTLSAPANGQEPHEGTPAGQDLGEPVRPATDVERPGDPLAALEAALARLGDEQGTGESDPLPFARGRRAKREAPAAAAAASRTDDDTRPELARVQREERLEQLRRSQPLLGIVSGPEGSIALIGGRSVRVGDLLVDGDARVLECTPTGVRIEFEGEPAWIALPGLRTHAAPPRVPATSAAPPPIGPAGTTVDSAHRGEGGQP